MPQDLVVNGDLYRHNPISNANFPYVGKDGVRYRRHENGEGLVAETATVFATVHVGPQCRVFGYAHLSGKVRLTGLAQVGGLLQAYGEVTFAGKTCLTKGIYAGNGRLVYNKKDS